jgi:hypothetical protein
VRRTGKNSCSSDRSTSPLVSSGKVRNKFYEIAIDKSDLTLEYSVGNYVQGTVEYEDATK